MLKIQYTGSTYDSWVNTQFNSTGKYMKPPEHWRDILTRKVIINLRDEPEWLIEFIRKIQADAKVKNENT